MKKDYLKGIKLGIPIGLGYAAVAFSVGLYGSKAGLTPLEAMFSSLLLNASAGEYAAFTIIKNGGTLIAMVFAEFIANIRYLLMSLSLSQKMDSNFTIPKRLLIGIAITDEMFGVASGQEGKVSFSFYLGMMTVAVPCWALGTLAGAIVGDLIPTFLVNSLSVGLYGMFIAIVIPEGKKNKIVLAAIIASAVGSYLLNYFGSAIGIESGIATVIVTIVVSAVFAIVKPIKGGNANE